ASWSNTPPSACRRRPGERGKRPPWFRVGGHVGIGAREARCTPSPPRSKCQRTSTLFYVVGERAWETGPELLETSYPLTPALSPKASFEVRFAEQIGLGGEGVVLRSQFPNIAPSRTPRRGSLQLFRQHFERVQRPAPGEVEDLMPARRARRHDHGLGRLG